MFSIPQFHSSILGVHLLLQLMLHGFKCEFIHETKFAADTNFKLTDEILEGQQHLLKGGDTHLSLDKSFNEGEYMDDSKSNFDLNLDDDDHFEDYLEGPSRGRRESTSLKKLRYNDGNPRKNIHNAMLNDEFRHDLDLKKSSGHHGMDLSSGIISRPNIRFDTSTDRPLNKAAQYNNAGPIRHNPNFKHESNWDPSPGKGMKHALSSLAIDNNGGDLQSCHPATSRPKVSMQSTTARGKNNQEYEDMLKGKVAERIVAVIHAKVCKSPKLAQFFGNCEGAEPAKDNKWEVECNPLFKPETVKEIMSQMENINTSETCHKLPPKLYEFLEWLIKVKPARYTAPKKERRSFCDHYTDCAKGDSAFLFHAFDEDLGRPDNEERNDRYRRNSYLYQEYNDFYSDDDEAEEILLRNERSAQLIDSLSQTLTQLNVIEDTDSKQLKPTRANDKAIASPEERTNYLESIPRSERSSIPDAVRNQSVGFDLALAENVPMPEVDE